MELKNFKDIQLSRLGMGNMRLPLIDDREGAPIDRVRAQEIIDYAMAQGINYYDTAYVYHNGESEKFLGEAMKKYPRDSYYLATKFFYVANPDYKAVFEEQLERLQTDHVDFYLIHSVTSETYQQYLDCGCIEYFEAQKKAGRIKYLGFSSHADPKELEIFASYRQWDFAQIQLNYYDWVYGTAREEYEILEKHNIPIMVMEPVRGGRLASLCPEGEKMLRDIHPDWSNASWALRFVKALPQVQTILSGMSTFEQIQDNIATFSDGSALSDAEKENVYKAAELLKKYLNVPCTACRYCCDGCPMQIEIPKLIEIYNGYKLNGAWGLSDRIAAAESEGKPADCIACGACMGHCPQSIEIPQIMSELAEFQK